MITTNRKVLEGSLACLVSSIDEWKEQLQLQEVNGPNGEGVASSIREVEVQEQV